MLIILGVRFLRFVSGGRFSRSTSITPLLEISPCSLCRTATCLGRNEVQGDYREAASALGLRPNRTMSLVVLPQALRVIIPPLISQYLNITKNSSLAIAVGYADITATLGGITLNQTGRAIECVLLLMLFYLTISLLISAFMNVYNNSMKLKER